MAEQVLAHDPLVYIRTQALQMIFRLLQGNAEQEQNLLRLGANKLVSWGRQGEFASHGQRFDS